MVIWKERFDVVLDYFAARKIHQLGRSFSNLILSSSLKRQKLAQ
jgi:hypothetical protein